MKGKPPGAVAPLLIGIAAFVAFLGVVVLLNRSPELERSRAGRALFTLSYLTLIAVELVMYYRLRRALAYRNLVLGGGMYVVGTRRKGWYPLLRAIAEAQRPRRLHFVWWLERSDSPVGVLDLHRPPVDLPFGIVVTPEGASYIPLGELLRPYRSRPIVRNAREAVEALVARGGGGL